MPTTITSRPFLGQGREGLVDLPLTGEAGRGVEQVLPVVHVQHRVAAAGRERARRKVDQDVTGRCIPRALDARQDA